MAVIFIITWFVLLFYAVRLISKGWSAASELGGKQFINEQKKYVTKTIHPEMRDIKEGDELLVVNFEQPKKELDPRFKLDSPELHNLGDPLQQSLRDRINELNDNDDEDDDGDVPSVVRR